MKKIPLLCIVILITFLTSAQNFWTEVAPFSIPANNIGLYYRVNQISIVDNDVVWVTGFSGPPSNAKWSRSTDGGLTWQSGNYNFANSDFGISSIFAISDTRAYVSVHPLTSAPQNVVGVWLTVDAGATWTQQTSAVFNTAASWPNFIHFFDQNHGLVVGDPSVSGNYEIYTTTNGGVDWVAVPIANIPAPIPSEYGYNLNFDAKNDTIWFGTNKGRIYKSTNQGLNWTVNQSPLADFEGASGSGSFTFKDANEGLLTDNEYHIWRTLDGGLTWNDETTTTQGVLRNYRAVNVPGTANSYFSWGRELTNNLLGCSFSTNGGLDWQDLSTVTDVVPSVAEFNSGTMGFCIGATYSNPALKFYKLTDPLYRMLKTNTFDEFKTSLKVSPNPSNGIFKISANGQINKIEIFDIAGKKINSSEISNLKETELDLSGYDNGIYIAKISNAENKSTSLKLIKI